MVKVIRMKSGEEYRGEKLMKLVGDDSGKGELMFFNCGTQSMWYVPLEEIESIDDKEVEK